MRAEDSIAFFDWESQMVIRRIEVAPKAVYWNEDGTRVALALEEGTYVLRCNKEVSFVCDIGKAIATYLANPSMHNEEGIEAAFEVDTELNETVSVVPQPE